MQANGQTITVTGHFEEDTNNDLTPDKYQVFVNYVSEDDTKGTLSGTVSEVFTAEKNTDGTYKETVSFTAKAVATINVVDGFAFDKWTEDYSDRSNTTGIFSSTPYRWVRLSQSQPLSWRTKTAMISRTNTRCS